MGDLGSWFIMGPMILLLYGLTKESDKVDKEKWQKDQKELNDKIKKKLKGDKDETVES